MLGRDLIKLNIFLKESDRLRLFFIKRINFSSYYLEVSLGLGLMSGRGTLLDVIFLCVKYKTCIYFHVFKFLNKYFDLKFNDCLYAFYNYDGSNPTDLTSLGDGRTLIESLTQSKKIIKEHVLEGNISIIFRIQQEQLKDFKMNEFKIKTSSKRVEESTKNNEKNVEAVYYKKIEKNKEKIKKTYDLDALIGISYFHKFQYLFWDVLEISLCQSHLKGPLFKNLYLLNNKKTVLNKTFLHLYLGISDSVIGKFNWYIITDIEKIQESLAIKLLKLYNLFVYNYFFDGTRDPHRVYCSSNRPIKFRFNSKIYGAEEDIKFSNFKKQTLLSDEFECFFYKLNEIKELKLHCKAVYFECFGSKSRTHKENYENAIKKLDLLPTIGLFEFILLDNCISASPAAPSNYESIFQSIPTKYNSSKSHIFNLFFCSKSRCFNKNLLETNNGNLKINADGIWKENLYNGFYRKIVPDRLRLLKGAPITAELLSDLVGRFSNKKAKKLANKFRCELKKIPKNISKLDSYTLPFRNEFRTFLVNSPVYIHRKYKEVKEAEFFIFNNEDIKNLILNFIKDFNTLINNIKEQLNIENLKKLLVCEILFFENFLKGTRNCHSLKNPQYQTWFKELICDSFIPKYNLKNLAEEGSRQLESGALINILTETFSYAIYSPQEKKRLDLIITIISGNFNEQIMIRALDGLSDFMLKRLHNSKISKNITLNATPITFWVLKLIDFFCSDKTPRFILETEEIWLFRFVVKSKCFNCETIKDFIANYFANNSIKIVIDFTIEKKLSPIKILYLKPDSDVTETHDLKSIRNEIMSFSDKFRKKTKFDWTNTSYAKLIFGLDKYKNNWKEVYYDPSFEFFCIISKNNFYEGVKRIRGKMKKERMLLIQKLVTNSLIPKIKFESMFEKFVQTHSTITDKIQKDLLRYIQFGKYEIILPQLDQKRKDEKVQLETRDVSYIEHERIADKIININNLNTESSSINEQKESEVGVHGIEFQKDLSKSESPNKEEESNIVLLQENNSKHSDLKEKNMNDCKIYKNKNFEIHKKAFRNDEKLLLVKTIKKNELRKKYESKKNILKRIEEELSVDRKDSKCLESFKNFGVLYKNLIDYNSEISNFSSENFKKISKHDNLKDFQNKFNNKKINNHFEDLVTKIKNYFKEEFRFSSSDVRLKLFSSKARPSKENIDNILNELVERNIIQKIQEKRCIKYYYN